MFLPLIERVPGSTPEDESADVALVTGLMKAARQEAACNSKTAWVKVSDAGRGVRLGTGATSARVGKPPKEEAALGWVMSMGKER